MSVALQMEGIVKRFGRRRALDGLNLTVPTGSITGLIGSNGAGKTTALGVAAGYLRPQAGRIDLLESGPFQADRHAGRFAILPQDAELPREARPLELLTFYGALQGLPRREAARQAARLLDRVHLADRAQSPMRTLSHGMRKRISVAQCFLGDPELILLDEPLSGLDPLEATGLREFFASCRGRQTLVISSHNLHDIEQICDRAAFIEHGQTLREDTVQVLTGRDGVCFVRLAHATAPLDLVRTMYPRCAFEFDQATQTLSCRFPISERTPADMNRALIESLFAAGIGILEIRLGETLEQKYLRQVTTMRRTGE